MQGLIKLTLCVVLFISQICFCSASDRGTFFWATDMHVDIWGDSGNPEDMICAWTPSSQLLSAVAAMKEQNADPDFILGTK